MPYLLLGAGVLGAALWNQLDDSIIDPVTGSGSGDINPGVVFLVGVAVGVMIKHRGIV